MNTATTRRTAPEGTRRPRLHAEETGVEIRAIEDGAGLPEGVCGRIIVTALTFNVIDTYGTSFAPGCADRSIGQRVQSGKIPLLTDHDNEVRKHVGVVRAMPTAGDAYLGECDILDTEDGRRFLEYAKACVAARAVTGASIRFVPRAWETLKDAKGERYERFTEIELRELTVVPMSSVPGTDLLGAREDGDGAADTQTDTTGVDTLRDDATLLEEAARLALDAMAPDARAVLLTRYTETVETPPARADAATDPTPTVRNATMDERIMAVRQTLA